ATRASPPKASVGRVEVIIIIISRGVGVCVEAEIRLDSWMTAYLGLPDARTQRNRPPGRLLTDPLAPRPGDRSQLIHHLRVKGGSKTSKGTTSRRRTLRGRHEVRTPGPHQTSILSESWRPPRTDPRGNRRSPGTPWPPPRMQSQSGSRLQFCEE